MEKNISTIFILFTILLVSACKSKNNNNPASDNSNNNVSTGTLFFHLHNYIDEVEVDEYNIVYQTDAGRKISLAIGQYYVSNIELVKLDGSFYSIPDITVLKTQDNETYQIANVPVGNYKSVRFKIGLSTSVNAHTPSSSGSDIFNRPEMWFSSSAQPDGYIFMNCEGKIDTTTAANGSTADMQPFHFHIGTNDGYTQVVMPDKNFTILKDQAQFVHMIADYNKLFNGIQLNSQSNLTMTTPSDNATALGIKIRNNISSMFSYEQ